MNFLKKLAQIIIKAGEVAAELGGITIPFLGSGKAKQYAVTGINDLTSVAATVAQIEVALDGKTGDEKLEAAVNLVGPILRTSELVVGKKVKDEARFEKAVTAITQGVYDLLSSLHEDEAKEG